MQQVAATTSVCADEPVWRLVEHGRRLLLLELRPPLTLENVTTLTAAVIAGAKRRQPEPVVFAADLRQIAVMSPEVAERFLAMLKTNNPFVERTAVLLANDAGVLALQVERLFRTSRHPGRRCFTDPREVCDWLGEVTIDAQLLAARWGAV